MIVKALKLKLVVTAGHRLKITKLKTLFNFFLYNLKGFSTREIIFTIQYFEVSYFGFVVIRNVKTLTHFMNTMGVVVNLVKTCRNDTELL